MTVLAFALGAALLGLAGWFIAASAVAGLAVASTFSFLFPSAAVHALAWARTLSRYGERITTHQATLDLVASLRTSLFGRALRLPRDRVAEPVEAVEPVEAGRGRWRGGSRSVGRSSSAADRGSGDRGACPRCVP